MLQFTEKYNNRLPNLSIAKRLVCFSDYSGEEKESDFSVYSFLIIDGDNLKEWNESRTRLRKELLADGRRVSFKNYRDKLSQEYISAFLHIVDDLRGYLVTISVSKQLPSLFENASPINVANPKFQKYLTWTKDTAEKIFRVIHFLGFFIAGFSSEKQDIIWITDDDKIAPNKEKVSHLTELFSYICSGYLTHNLGHLRIGTTKSDDGSRLIEDLCSIPDLIAGAYSDHHKSTQTENNQGPNGLFWLYSSEFKKKTNKLTRWLWEDRKCLCKVCLQITPNEAGGQTIFFHHFF